MQRTTNWAGVTFGLALASFAAYQQFKLPPVLPLLLERFGYDRLLAGGFMGIYAVAGLLFTLAFAARFQRGQVYPILWLALGLMLVGNLATWAFAATGWAVLLARGAEGIAFAACSVAGPATAAASASPRHLPLIMGLSAAWIPFGQIVASLLAQPALASGDWQIVWWAAIAMTLVFGGWLARLQATRRAPIGGQHGGGAAVPLTARQRATLWIAAAAFMLFSFQYFGYMTWLPQYLVEVQGLGPDQALLGYLLPVVVLAGWNVIAGWLLRRGLTVGMLFFGGMVLQGGCWWLLPVTGGGAWGLVSLVAYGIGAGLAPTALFSLPSRLLPPGQPATPAFAILMTGRNVGVLTGPLALAQLSKLPGGWDLAAPVYGGVATLSLLCGLCFTWRLRRVHPPAPHPPAPHPPAPHLPAGSAGDSRPAR